MNKKRIFSTPWKLVKGPLRDWTEALIDEEADARGYFNVELIKELGRNIFPASELLTKIMEHYHVSSVVRKSMKIVHIIIGLNIGGAELSLKRLIDTQHKNNNFNILWFR